MRETIQTDRLTLRRPRADDAAAMAHWTNDFDVTRQTGTIPFPFTQMHAEMWLMMKSEHWRNQTRYDWMIDFKGAMIGTIGLFYPNDPGRVEVGYMLARNVWGQGLATEAVTAILRMTRDDLGHAHCHAGVFKDNPGSQRVLQKLGFYVTNDSDRHFSMARGQMAPGRNYRCDLAALDS